MSDNKRDFYLILGASRGGTTLLAAALGAHPDIAMFDEDKSDAFTRITGGKTAGTKLCIPNQIEYKRRWHPLCALLTLNGFLRKSRLSARLPRSPYSIMDFAAMGHMRPICILRSPSGVLKGIQTREHRSLCVAKYRWKRCLEVFDILNENPEFSPVFVSFEKLVREPEQTLKNLCAALNIKYDPKMLEAPASNQRYETASGFDPSKARHDADEDVWDNFDADVKSRYDRILKLCV
ncbi:MAG: hypothetical protein AB7E85_07785 [Pseudobdellovibrionaceae bacterium]